MSSDTFLDILCLSNPFLDFCLVLEIGFGMEGGSSAKSTRSNVVQSAKASKRHPASMLLVEDEDAVVDLMTLEGIDPTIIAELEKMV